MSFGLPALIGANKQPSGVPIEDTITFCTQDISVFNRTFSPVPITGTATFCTQDISVFNRTFSPVPITDTATFCTQDISVFNRPVIAIDAVTGDDYIDRAEKTSSLNITGTATDIPNGQGIQVTVFGQTYNTTVASEAWSVTVPQSDLARYWAGLGEITAVTNPDIGFIATPRSIVASTDVINWYDASDASSITLSGSNIDQVDDKGLVGTDNLTPQDATKPTYTTGALNGLNAITFGASEDRLRSTTVRADNGFMVFVVYESNTNTTGSSTDWKYIFDGITNRSAFALSHASNSGAGIFGGFWADSSPSKTVDLDPHLAVLGYDPSNASMRIDGSELVLSPDVTGNSNLLGLVLGQDSVSNIHQFQGNIYELGILPNNIPIDNQRVIEGYLANKWGLTGNLPTAHVFSQFPPPLWSPEKSLDHLILLNLKFEGTNGATATVDHSAYNHPITFNGGSQVSTAQFAPGGSTSSCLFNGTTGYLTLSSVSAINLANRQCRIMVDIYPLTNTGDRTILNWLNDDVPSTGWKLHISSGTLFFDNGGASGSNQRNLGAIITGAWLRVIIDYDGTNLTIYRNGSQVDTSVQDLTAPTVAVTTLAIGASRTAGGAISNHYHGYLDNIHIDRGSVDLS